LDCLLDIGEGPEYRPFRNSRVVPEAGRPREQVENYGPREQVENDGRACTQVLFLHKAALGFFHFLEIVTGWLAGTFDLRRSHLLKTKQVSSGR
jgi:hypothetical protein